MKISTDRLEKAITYLVDTDERAAELKSDVERAEYKAKAIRDAVFLRSQGTVAERTAIAGASDEYDEAMKSYFELLGLCEAMRNKRNTESIVIDCWRSLNAGRNKGNIV